VQEAGEYHAADPVYRASLDGGRASSLQSALSDDGAADSPGQPLLGRTVSVSLHNPRVAKEQLRFRTTFQTELASVSAVLHQELQQLNRDIDTLAEQEQALAASYYSVRPDM
jgi:hypothetical protein